MIVEFFTGFEKRRNSTKRPTVTGTQITVALKENTSIETPVFILSGTLGTIAAYNYLKWDSRYYYVTDAVYVHNNVMEVHCILDVLATYKTAIGTSLVYIERCASGANKNLPDDLISWTDNARVKSFKLGRPFLDNYNYDYITYTADGMLNNWYNYQKGIVAATIISVDCSRLAGGCSGLYIFDAENSATSPAPISALLTALNSRNFWNDLTNIVRDVHSAIIKLVYIPWVDISAFGSGGVFENAFEKAEVVLGDQYVTGIYGYRHKLTNPPVLYRKNFSINLPSITGALYHPVDYMWANCAPFSKWVLYLPYYGTVEIDMSDFLEDQDTTNGTTLYVQSFYDISTGELEYQILKQSTYDEGGTTRTMRTIINTFKTCLGVSIPLSQITGTPDKFVTNLITGAAAAASQNYAMFAMSAVNGISSLMGRHLSTSGGFSSSGVNITAIEPLDVMLLQITRDPSESLGNSLVTLGYPLRKEDVIQNHSGYIKCINASVSMPGHEQDKTAVDNYLNSGFFYE